MKKLNLIIAMAVTVVFSGNSFSGDTHSGRSVEEGVKASSHAGKASSHASASAGHAIVGSGQVTSAASAVPLAVSGSAGAVSTEIAKDLRDAATAPVGTPLEVTDESVTAGVPPSEALDPKKSR